MVKFKAWNSHKQIWECVPWDSWGDRYTEGNWYSFQHKKDQEKRMLIDVVVSVEEGQNLEWLKKVKYSLDPENAHEVFYRYWDEETEKWIGIEPIVGR